MSQVSNSDSPMNTTLSILVNVGSTVAGNFLLGNPIGATGAAIFGLGCAVGEGISNWIGRDVVKNPYSDVSSKIAITALRAFVEIIISWKLTELFGISLALKSAVTLYATSVAVAITSTVALTVILGVSVASALGVAVLLGGK